MLNLNSESIINALQSYSNAANNSAGTKLAAAEISPISPKAIAQVFQDLLKQKQEYSVESIQEGWKQYATILERQNIQKEDIALVKSLFIWEQLTLSKDAKVFDILASALLIALPDYFYSEIEFWPRDARPDTRAKMVVFNLDKTELQATVAAELEVEQSEGNKRKKNTTAVFDEHLLQYQDNFAQFEQYYETDLDKYKTASFAMNFISLFSENISRLLENPIFANRLALISAETFFKWLKTFFEMYVHALVNYFAKKNKTIPWPASKIIQELMEGTQITSGMRPSEIVQACRDQAKRNITLGVFPAVTQEEKDLQKTIFLSQTDLRDASNNEQRGLIQATTGLTGDASQYISDAADIGSIQVQSTTQDLAGKTVEQVLEDFYLSHAFLIYEVNPDDCSDEIYTIGCQRLWDNFTQRINLNEKTTDGARQCIAEYNPKQNKELHAKLRDSFYLAMSKKLVTTISSATSNREKRFAHACEAVAIVWMHPSVLDSLQLSNQNTSLTGEKNLASLEEATKFMDEHPEMVDKILTYYGKNTSSLKAALKKDHQAETMRCFCEKFLPYISKAANISRAFNNFSLSLNQYFIAPGLEELFDQVGNDIRQAGPNIIQILSSSIKKLLELIFKDFKATFIDFNQLDQLVCGVANFSADYTDIKKRNTAARDIMSCQLTVLLEKVNQTHTWIGNFYTKICMKLTELLNSLPINSESFDTAMQNCIENIAINKEDIENTIEAVIMTISSKAHDAVAQETVEITLLDVNIIKLIEALQENSEFYIASFEKIDVQKLLKSRNYHHRFLVALDDSTGANTSIFDIKNYEFIQGYLEEHLDTLDRFDRKNFIYLILCSNAPMIDKLKVLGAIGQAENNHPSHKIRKLYLGLSQFVNVTNDNIESTFNTFRKAIAAADAKEDDLTEVERHLQRRILRAANKTQRNFETHFLRWVRFVEVSKTLLLVEDLSSIKASFTLKTFVRCFERTENIECLPDSDNPSEGTKSAAAHDDQKPKTKIEKKPQPTVEELQQSLQTALEKTAVVKILVKPPPAQQCGDVKSPPAQQRGKIVKDPGQAGSNANNVDRPTVEEIPGNVADSGIDAKAPVKTETKAETALKQVIFEQLKIALKQFSRDYVSGFFTRTAVPAGMQMIIDMLRDNSTTIHALLTKIKEIADPRITDRYSEWAAYGGLRSVKTQAAYQNMATLLNNIPAPANHEAQMDLLHQITTSLNQTHQKYCQIHQDRGTRVSKNIAVKM